MFYDILTYVIPVLMLVGVLVLLIQRRFATAAFGVSAGSVIVHYIVTSAMYEAIAMGDGFGWRESVNYQPGSQPDWGWVSFAPQWVFDGPLILAGVFFVLGVFLAVGFAVLRGLADKKKIAERSWFWPVGQLRAV